MHRIKLREGCGICVYEHPVDALSSGTSFISTVFKNR